MRFVGTKSKGWPRCLGRFCGTPGAARGELPIRLMAGNARTNTIMRTIYLAPHHDAILLDVPIDPQHRISSPWRCVELDLHLLEGNAGRVNVEWWQRRKGMSDRSASSHRAVVLKRRAATCLGGASRSPAWCAANSRQVPRTAQRKRPGFREHLGQATSAPTRGMSVRKRRRA